MNEVEAHKQIRRLARSIESLKKSVDKTIDALLGEILMIKRENGICYKEGCLNPAVRLHNEDWVCEKHRLE